MRTLSAALAGITLVVGLSSPAWAAGTDGRHHRSSGRSASPGRRPGDSIQHDDPSILF